MTPEWIFPDAAEVEALERLDYIDVEATRLVVQGYDADDAITLATDRWHAIQNQTHPTTTPEEN